MAFEILTADQLIQRLKGRKYKYTQIHHTWEPNHADFNGKNHLELQQGMKNYHVNTRGWDDIGQHVTLMPDGTFVTGRPFNKTPAGISGYNTGAFMTEMLGDFDKGKDKLEGKQLEAIIKVQRFLVNECGAEIMFHREHASKTCPGTGIDKTWFVNLIKNPPKKEGWQKEDSVWYFYQDGVKVKNQWRQDSKKLWYYLGEDSTMATNRWIRWKNKWYWVGSDGAMVCNGQITIKSKPYSFRKDGSLIMTDPNGAVIE